MKAEIEREKVMELKEKAKSENFITLSFNRKRKQGGVRKMLHPLE